MKLNDLCKVILLSSFVSTAIAAPVGYVYRMYSCPTAKQFQQYLIKGEAIRVCPIDKTGKPLKCDVVLRMHPLLAGYGGYAPREPFTVLKSYGYYHHQCHYLVEIDKDNGKYHTYGHFLLNQYTGSHCGSIKNSTWFECILSLDKESDFTNNNLRL